MDTPAFDFRVALSGSEADPSEDPERETGEERRTGQGPREVRPGSLPISIDLNTGTLLLRNGSGTVEVDTANREAVVRPADPDADPGDGDGGLIVLRSTRAEERQQPAEALPAEAAPPVGSVRPPGTGERRGVLAETEHAPLAQVRDGAPAEPVHGHVLRTVRVEEPREGDVSGTVRPPASQEHDRLLLRTETTADPGGGKGLPVREAVVEDAVPYGVGAPRTGPPPTGSAGTGEGTALLHPVAARSDVFPAGSGPAPDAQTHGEDTAAESGGLVVTVDPETGRATVEVGDLRLVVDPERGTISVDPGDLDVPLDAESEPVTVEAGDLRLTVDPEKGTVVVEFLEPGEGTEGPEEFTIEIGDLRVTVDPETGEVTVDPGDGEVEVDPETGLVTITGPEEDEESPTEGEEGGLPQEGRGHTSGGGEGESPRGEDTQEPVRSSGSGGSGGDQARLSPLTPLTPTVTMPRTAVEEDGEATAPERTVPEENLVDVPEETVPGGPVGGVPNTPVPGEAYQDVVTGEAPDPAAGGPLPAYTSSHPDTAFRGLPPTESPAPEAEPGPGETAGSGTGGSGNPATESTDGDEGEGGEEGPPVTEEDGPARTSSVPFAPARTSSLPYAPARRPAATEGTPPAAQPAFSRSVNPGTENTEGSGNDGDGTGGNGEGDGTGSGKGGDEGTAIDFDRLTQFRDKFVVPLREEVGTMMMKFAKYGGPSSGSESGGGSRIILIGNEKHLPIAGTVAGEIDTSMGTLYTILSEMESELLLVEDRLRTNMRAFMDLEEEQKLTAEEVVSIIGPPSVGNGSGGGPSGGGTTEKP